MTSNVLGSQASGIIPNTWYSIQSFANDYYLGLTHTNGAQIQLLSDVDDSTLWQFIPAGPDVSRGVYAMRSKASDAVFCLYTNSSVPTPVPCDANAGQIRVFNTPSGDADDGLILVPYAEQEANALSAAGDASEGDPVEYESLGTEDEVEILWAFRSRSAVDTAAYPTLSPTYNTPATVTPTTTGTHSNLSITSTSNSATTPTLNPTISVDTSRTIPSGIPITNVTISLTSIPSSGERSASTVTRTTEVVPTPEPSNDGTETDSETPAVQSTNAAAVVGSVKGVVTWGALGLVVLGLWMW